MISSFDCYKQIENSNMYLCNPDSKPLYPLQTESAHFALRFNDLSELTFTVPKIEELQGSYKLVETKRLILVENIGWFQIVSVTETTEGDSCRKEVIAQSHQTVFKNRGFISEERIYMFYNPNDEYDALYDSSNVAAIPSVIGQLNKQLGIRLDVRTSDFVVDRDYGEWTIVYIDPSLRFEAKSYGAMYESAEGAENICRSFQEETTYGYDFIINQVEKAFNVIFEFDFLHRAIKIKRIDDVTLPTDIYLSFENVMNTMDVSENAEDIVTVLTCNGNGLDIATVNPMGTNYIVNFDYYKKKVSDDCKTPYPWMSKELITVLDEWKLEYEKWQQDDNSRNGHEESYSTLVGELQKLYEKEADLDAIITHAKLKLSDLQKACEQFVNKEKDAVDGTGLIVVETVEDGEKSKLPTSMFYSNPIYMKSTYLTAYKNVPRLIEVIDEANENGEKIQWHYQFGATPEDGSVNPSKYGTPQDLIIDFIDTEEDATESYLYFFDELDHRSYCKLNIETEVGVVKDENNNISQSGVLALNGHEFNLEVSQDSVVVLFNDGVTTPITVSKVNPYFTYGKERYKIVISSDGITSVYYYYVSGYDRYTTYIETTGSGKSDDSVSTWHHGWVSIWEQYIGSDNETAPRGLLGERKELENTEINPVLEKIKYITECCNIQKFVKNKSVTLYNEFYNYWIEGEFTNDNLSTTETTSMSERINLAKQLLASGEVELKKVSQPSLEMTVSAIDFTKLIEFETFCNQLELGRTITIEKRDDEHYRPVLMTVEFDKDSVENFSLKFSTTGKLEDTSKTYAELLKETSSTSRTVSANWSNLMDYSNNKETITKLIEEPLNSALRAATSNLANQQFIVDESGILGRKWIDESQTSYSPEQIRVINNTILFTKDNWQTSALALGKITYEENGASREAYGLVADVLVGNLILSNEMSIGSNDGRVKVNDQGISIIDSTGKTVFNADTAGDLNLWGNVHAKEGELGGLRIEEDGSLVTDNFKIENITVDGKTETELVLFGDNFKTSINTSSINTLYINCKTLSATEGISTSGFFAAGGITLSDNSIVSSGTSISFDNEDLFETYNIKISDVMTANGSSVKISINPSPSTAITGTYKYYTVFGNNEKVGSFSFTPGGSLELYFYYDHFFGIKNLSITSVNGENTTGTSVDVTVSLGKAISIKGNLLPSMDNEYTLGNGDKRWSVIYASSATINTSDRNEKFNITNIDDRYSTMFDLLEPSTYMLKDGTSKRVHIGLIAQGVKEAALKSGIGLDELAAYCEWVNSSGDISCGLRYSEFIPLNISEIQKIKKRVDIIENELKGIKGEI